MRNLKRALSLALASVMVLGLMVVGSGASYADVTSEENQEAIEVLQAVGVMVGDDEGNFNPDNPYNGNEVYTCHTTNIKSSEDITDIDNYNGVQIVTAIQKALAESAIITSPTDINALEEISQYQNILSQYDSLIKDSSYKGINLLQSQDLKVTFNESRSAWLDVKGKDASSAALGLTTTEWNTIEDIAQSLKEISSALNQIRTISAELGSYYNIVLNRQDFTENLINVLEEGAAD